jgi:Flp pilus assembly protein TadG
MKSTLRIRIVSAVATRQPAIHEVTPSAGNTEENPAMTLRTGLHRRDGRNGAHGQMIVLFGLCLIAIIAMAGLLIDGGMAWANRRQAQAAADTAALAGAKAIAGGNVTTAAQIIGGANGFGAGTDCGGNALPNAGVTVNRPPLTGPHTVANDPVHANDYVEVITTRKMATTFASAVGQSCWMVSARAVAQATPATPTGPAILALDTNCGGGGKGTLKWGGADINVIGDVISNGGIDWSGSGGGVASGYKFTYVSPPCSYDPHTNLGLPNQAQPVTSIMADPFTFTTADFHCSNGPSLPSKLQLPSSGTVIPDGTYCATDSITIKTATSTCAHCTLIAPGIAISAADVNLEPNEHGVLLWATGTAGVNWSGSSGYWGGIVYSPNGNLQISGATGETISGNIWGLTVQFPGSGWSIQAPTSGANKAVVKLVE